MGSLQIIFGQWAALVMKLVSNTSLQVSAPSWQYYAVVLGCIAVAVIGIVAILPMIKGMTSPEENRAE